MTREDEFQVVVLGLKSLLKPYRRTMKVVSESETGLYLDTHHIMKNKKPLFFASVRRGKSYVSFYLMPLYVYPDLSRMISPNLARHRQGKSCFNFKKIDKQLFKELGKLTKTGFHRYRADHYV